MRLLIFVALMLALLKYNQQVMSAVNAPAELIGFLLLPGFMMSYLSAATPGRLALAIELGCFTAVAALLILGTAGIGFLRPITWRASANLPPRRSPRRCPWPPYSWLAE